MTSIRPLLLLADGDGGVGRHVASLHRFLDASAVRAQLACPAATGRRFGLATASGFTALEIADRSQPAGDLRAVRGLSRLISRTRPDVVHAHGLRAGALAVLAGRTLGAARPPLIVHWHNVVTASGSRRSLLTGLELLAARGADVTLGACDDLVARARSLGAHDARIGPVAAAPLPEPSADRDTVRDRLGFGPGPLVLAVGSLTPQRNYDGLLAAAELWRHVLPEATLCVVGAGSQPHLQDRAAARDLPVRFLGARDDVAELLRAADLAVIASHWEARSLFAQEALRAGVPLVSTAVGGIPELVGEAARLVPPDDPKALADAVVAVLTRPELGARLAVAGPTRAACWPDETEVAAGTLALYEYLRRSG